jgi:hypothetical protein
MWRFKVYSQGSRGGGDAERRRTSQSSRPLARIHSPRLLTAGVMRTNATEMTEDELDVVHTVTERYDGPVRGIANLRGRPHYYERQFDAEVDEWSDIYWLMPID